MKRIMVIGDSISMQYGPYLQTMVEEFLEYTRLCQRGSDLSLTTVPENAGDSTTTLERLKREIDAGDAWDILLINCGLHDIKTTSIEGERQVPLPGYRANVKAIAELASASSALPIWVRTTPVHDELHAEKKPFLRFDSDVFIYNNVADDIMDAYGIPVADLYALSRSLGLGIWEDGVHFKDEVRKLQAAFLAGFIKSAAQLGGSNKGGNHG